MERKAGDARNRLGNNREMLIVCLFFFASTVLRYVLASFPKALETYGDEMLYYDIARSLFQGTGISVRNAAAGLNFQKIMYSVFLVPFFAVGNGVVRIRMITLFNCMLMSSCVFPVWLMAGELQLKRQDRLFIVLALTVWPDMLASMTFMAEILYWPVVIWFLYLWTLNERKKSFALAILEGVLCYIGYMTKEVFLAVVVGYAALIPAYPIVNRILGGKQPRVEGRGKYNLREVLMAGVVVLTFLVCNVASSKLIFIGQSNGYDAAVNVQNIWTANTLLYLIYYFFYYLAAVLLSILIVPFTYSLAGWKRLPDDRSRKLFCLVTLISTVFAGTVALTIAIKENFGQMAPRIHLRYVEPVVFIYLICYLMAARTIEAEDSGKTAKGRNILTVLITCLVGLLYKGTFMGSSVDHFTMHWYSVLQNKLAGMGITGDICAGFRMEGIAILILLIILFSMTFLMRSKGRHEMALTAYLAFMLGLCLVNNQVGSRYTIDPYKTEPQIIEEVGKINRYFEDIGKGESKIYVTVGMGNSQMAQCFDTYFDDMDRLIVTNSSWLEGLTPGMEANVSGMQFSEPVFHAQYDLTEDIDYVIVDRDVDLGVKCFTGLKEISDLSGSYYTVYRNINAQTIGIDYNEETKAEDVLISFAGDDYNADRYVTGISGQEEGFSWTDGDVVSVTYPTDDDGVIWDVDLEILGTFNGMKSYEVRDYSGQIVAQGSIDVPGTISFSIMSSEGRLAFDMALPDSLVVNKVWPNSTDTRKLALQITCIRLSRHIG